MHRFHRLKLLRMFRFNGVADRRALEHKRLVEGKVVTSD